MAGLLDGIRDALWQLRRNPAFTGLRADPWRLGIGANTAIFSVVNAVLLKPLPYAEADRLVVLGTEFTPELVPECGLRSQLPRLETAKPCFRRYGCLRPASFNLAGGSRPEEVAGGRVTTNLFSVLGVQALHGRLFLPEEERRGRAAAIVSYGLWQRQYGADPALVGKEIALNGERYPVVGILPAGFTDDFSTSVTSHSQIWISGIEPFLEGRECMGTE